MNPPTLIFDTPTPDPQQILYETQVLLENAEHLLAMLPDCLLKTRPMIQQNLADARFLLKTQLKVLVAGYPLLTPIVTEFT
jgi:hypothetical protein